MADYAAKELKLKRMATISEDFAFGYEQVGGFQRVFEDAGGKIVKKLWPPLVTPDYTPYHRADPATSTACSTASPARTR